MIVQLSFKNKKVIIIGSGKQGQKKAQQFEQEGAIVTLVDQYEKNQISNQDIVFAATKDKQLNQQIIHDARKLGKECGSVHYDENATFHPNLQKEVGGLSFSLYYPGTSVYELRKFQKAIEELYEQSFKQEMEDIRYIRLRMIEENIQDRKEILEMLARFNRETIHHIRKAYETKETVLYCLHGTTKGAPLEYFHEFYAYEKKNPKVPSIEEMKVLFHSLQIQATYRLVFMQKGLGYERIRKQLEGENVENRILNEECIESLFSKEMSTLFIVHGQVNYEKLKKGKWQVMELEEEIPVLKEPCQVIPLFLVKAKHMKKDIFETIYPKIQERYPSTTFETRCLLEYPEIIKYITENRNS